MALQILICYLMVAFQEYDSTITISIGDKVEWYYIVPSDEVHGKPKSIISPDSSNIFEQKAFQSFKKSDPFKEWKGYDQRDEIFHEN